MVLWLKVHTWILFIAGRNKQPRTCALIGPCPKQGGDHTHQVHMFSSLSLCSFLFLSPGKHALFPLTLVLSPPSRTVNQWEHTRYTPAFSKAESLFAGSAVLFLPIEHQLFLVHYPLFHRYLGGFRVMSNSAMNIHIHGFVWTYVITWYETYISPMLVMPLYQGIPCLTL